MAIFSERIALTVSADTGGATKPLSQLATQASKTESAFDKAARAMGVSATTLKTGLVAGAAALIGTNLVNYLNDSVKAYGESAKAASDLANATGGTVDEVSRLTAAMTDAGVSADTTAGLLTKFTTNAGKQAKALDELNVSLVTGPGGMVDYAASMVAVVDAIGNVGDASRRNALLVQFFGKAGAKAFQDLYNSGVDLSEAMAAIDKYRVFDAADVRSAMAYDDAMDQLTASAKGLQFALGRTLAPALTAAAEATSKVLEATLALPGPVKVAAAAFVVLKAAMGTSLVTNALAAARGLDRTAVSIRGIGAAMKGLAASNAPLLILTGLITAITETVSATKNLEAFSLSLDRSGQSLREQAEELRNTDSVWSSFLEGLDVFSEGKTEDAMRQITGTVRSNAKATLESADATAAQERAASDLLAVLGDGSTAQQALNLDTEAGSKAWREYTASLSAAAAEALEVEETNRTLADIIASGVTSQEEFSAAVASAANAQRTQEGNTQAAKDAMAAYAAATWDAVNATLAQIDKEYARDEAQRSYRAQVEETTKVLRSSKSSADERAGALDDLGRAALNAASAEVELATQNALLTGTTLTAAEKNDLLIASLRKEKRGAGTKAERTEIQGLIDKLTTAQTTAGEGVQIDGVRWKSGTTESQVETLKADIKTALGMKDYDLAAELSAKLTGLQMPELTQTVNLVGADGEPLTAPTVDVTVTSTGADTVQTTLDSIGGQRSVEYKLVATNAIPIALTLKALAKTPRKVELALKATGQDRVHQILDDLTKARTAWINVRYRTVGTPPAAPEATTSSLGTRVEASAFAYAGGVEPMAAGYYKTTLQPQSREQVQVNVHLDSKRIASYLTTASGRRP